MSSSISKNTEFEGDSKSLARIDEILARSRRVVEESMELSKRTIEKKIKIDTALETSQSTENSFLHPRRINSKILEISEDNEAEESLNISYKRPVSEEDSKIMILEQKAEDDEKLLENLRQKVKNIHNIEMPSSSKLEYDILQADKLIQNLKETLAIGLMEENKRLKQDLENLLRRKVAEEAKLNKELDDIIKEKKTLEIQYNNLKYLHGHTPNYIEELENAKSELAKLEKESKETIELLERKIKEQVDENIKLKENVKNTKDNEKIHLGKVRIQEAKKNSSILKNIKNQ